MKQITVYESFDGISFQTEQECIDYERKHRTKFFTMYDWEGRYVDYVEQAVVIYIKYDYETEAYSILKTMSEEQGSPIDGITEGDCGWFYWDEYDEKYNYLSSDIVATLVKCNQ